jgi:hypothetical protein
MVFYRFCEAETSLAQTRQGSTSLARVERHLDLSHEQHHEQFYRVGLKEEQGQ